MAKVRCPAELCTYNQNKDCLSPDVSLVFRAAIDFPGKGTVVYFECAQQELPQDKKE